MYSDQVKEQCANPRNMGQLDCPDAEGRAGEPGRGNYMIIWLKVDGERIVDIGFKTYGCPPAIAAGSVVTQLALGKRVDEALAISREQLLEALGGLPLGREHCAALAIEALTNGLRALKTADGTLPVGGEQ